jgi:1-deoxy-D-xylulose 5-phosphate reductoisomerase
VIITSNQRSVANLGASVPVDVFSEAEALTFLAARTGQADAAGAGVLAAELGCLPLALAQAAARAGGLEPVVLNAANEVAVQAFLERRLNFPGIAAVIEAVVQRGSGGAIGALEDVLAADAEARVHARERIDGITRTAAVRGAHA